MFIQLMVGGERGSPVRFVNATTKRTGDEHVTVRPQLVQGTEAGLTGSHGWLVLRPAGMAPGSGYSFVKIINLKTGADIVKAKGEKAKIVLISYVQLMETGLKGKDGVCVTNPATLDTNRETEPAQIPSQLTEGKTAAEMIKKRQHATHTIVQVRKNLNGNWGDWGHWSQCDVTCALGNQIRKRSCDNPLPAFGGQECAGKETELNKCQGGPCPIWSAWFNGPCAATCGQGTYLQVRHCSTGVAKDCGGQQDNSLSVNLHLALNNYVTN
ncbi:CADN-like protein [Mya arenaria]|uniref:CADN-like protein n=1 Tax=Mya arenaria TaxID=6604 RepID=A0ABY7FXI1_MYAAR|nr:CADN-like protein [Mya arenaria]